MDAEMEMLDGERLKAFSNAPEGVIHVLVKEKKQPKRKKQRPESAERLEAICSSTTPKKLKLDVVEWQEEEMPVCSISSPNCQTYFENREEAVEQLHYIHGKTFKRADSGSGEEWEIPLADNALDLEESSFGTYYLQKCREMYQNERDEFYKSLCASHTIHIAFDEGDLLTKDQNSKMNQLIGKALNLRFKTPPQVLSKIPKTAHGFVNTLVKEAGPLFIVLDDIGKAFEDESLSEIERRDKFLTFCDYVLDDWLSIKGLFFLLVGHGSFLNFVAPRANKLPLSSGAFMFSGTSLRLLRPQTAKSTKKETM